MWTERFESMLMLMVMAALLRVSYEVSRSKPPDPAPILLPSTIGPKPQPPAWSAKAAQNYAQAQEKQWRRWNDAMFEKN
jgi:hypothetical protein